MPSLPELLLNDTSRQLISAAVKTDTNLLLSGLEGVGLKTIALALAEAINPSPGSTLLLGSDEEKDIGIEQVRALYQQTRAARSTTLSVIIDDADKMSREAQNALLKLLEEPPRNVRFILTSHNKDIILPTILSRLGSIEIRPISLQSSLDLITSRFKDEKKIAQIVFIAKGRPAEITRLVQNEAYFTTQVELMRDARQLLIGTSYERILTIHCYIHNRLDALALLNFTANLLIFNAQKSPPSAATMQCVETAIRNLHENGNTRLQLLRVAVNIG